ncbi:hypothetical protein [Nonomuraea endophytica]|uniref:Uncharacterized protein n=1 Tax=Nonomuraea endophytica TaxID=714136 RepID=A0A7W8AGI8_9ACTN|nr:hypothetical protein [Nonomuraea endophytica]MBB5085249.1 hypothetical protein [Nonomuraea endophytica]
MSGAEWIARCNAEQVGKKVRAVDPGDDFTRTITGGSLETGRWVVTAADGTSREYPGPDLQEIASGEADGPDNAFTRYGVDLDEYTAALIDAMQVGGAGEAEIAEAVLGVQVDAALPDDGPWYLYRVQGPNAD